MRDDISRTFSDSQLTWSTLDLWYRATYIVDDHEAMNEQPVALHMDCEDMNFIDIGKWKTIRWEFKKSPRDAEILEAFSDFNVEVKEVQDFKVQERQEAAFYSLLSPGGSSPDWL